jgi:hypothetical protein
VSGTPRRPGPAARRRTLVGGVSLCLVALAAPPARAQETLRRGDVTVGLDLGWTGYGSNAVEPSGARFAMYADWAVLRLLALEADISCQGGDERGATGPANFTLCTGSLGAKLYAPTRGRLMPYLRAAVGDAQLDRAAQQGVYQIDERSLALEAGAGVRWQLGAKRRWALRVDARVVRCRFYGEQATNGSVALGIAYRLGHRE